MEILRCDCSMGYVTVGPRRTRRFISVSFGKGTDRRSQTVLAERKALLNKGAGGRADCNYLRMTVSAGDQIISDVSRDQSRQKNCSSCGVRFTCSPTGGKGCWCEELAHVSLVAGADQDCLCPACLSAAIESWQELVRRFLLSLTCKCHHRRHSLKVKTITVKVPRWNWKGL